MCNFLMYGSWLSYSEHYALIQHTVSHLPGCHFYLQHIYITYYAYVPYNFVSFYFYSFCAKTFSFCAVGEC